jgi:hypothetical protein
MTHHKSKTLAAWLAVMGGCVGAHRFYLHGFKDLWGYVWLIPTSLGLYGVQRALELGQDDHLAWALIPWAGLSFSGACLAALIYGLMPDEKWNQHFNPQSPQHQTGWFTIFAVVMALLLGTTALISTIAFSGQRFFEYRLD